jgi:hypothetical protein
MGRRIDRGWKRKKTARNFDLFAAPLTGLFMLSALIASCIGNTIRWRGYHYHIGQGGAVRLLGKSIGDTWPIAAISSGDSPMSAPSPSDQTPTTLPFPKTSDANVTTSQRRQDAA